MSLRLHDRGHEVVLGVVAHLDLIAQLLEELRERPGRIHVPVDHVRLPVLGQPVGLFDGLRGLVLQAHDELDLGDDAGIAQELHRELVLLDRGLLAEDVQVQLGGRLGAERDMHQTGLAVEGQQVPVAHDVGHAGVDAPVDVDLAVDQLLAQCDELLLEDGGLFVGQDHEADVVVAHQDLDLVDELLGVPMAVGAPELPLGAEAAGEGTAAGEVGDRHPAVQRDIDVVVPVEQGPIWGQGIQVLDDRVGGGGHHLALLVEEGDALDAPTLLQVGAVVDGVEQVDDDPLAFAAHDVVDPGGLGQHLSVHEGRVNPAQHGHALGARLLGDLEGGLGLVDHGRDGGGQHHVRGVLADDLLQPIVRDVLAHGIHELDVGVARALDGAADICNPPRGPVTGNLGTARMVVRLDHQNAHLPPPKKLSRCARCRARTSAANAARVE